MSTPAPAKKQRNIPMRPSNAADAGPAPAVHAAEAETAPDASSEQDGLLEEEILVEEISIDGMCGVY